MIKKITTEARIRQILGNVSEKDKARKIFNLIKQDLLAIADRDENEELRLVVEGYFRK